MTDKSLVHLRPTIEDIDHLRSQLDIQLAELQRRFEVVKTRMQPRNWFTEPWAPLALGVGAGFALGASASLRVIFRSSLVALTTSMLRSWFTDFREPWQDPD